VTDFLFILARFWSCHSSLFNDWAMGLIIKESQFDSHISMRFFLLQNLQTLVSAHPPSLHALGALVPRVKQLGYENDTHLY
jgi:hypothetical protein